MKPYSYKFLGGLAVVTVGLTLTGCQQAAPPTTTAAPAAAPAPAQPAPTTTTESTSSTRSTEVKTDPSSPDGSAEKTVTHESTSTTKQ
jgi:hypothetical protein